MCPRVCVCVCTSDRPRMYSTSPQAKYKQLTQASFNLIDNVLKNNTAYFGCNASKLTMVTFPLPDTLLGRSAALERRAWWKGIKTGEMEETARLEWGEGPTNPNLNICLAYCGLAKLSKERHHLKWSCMAHDWQVFSYSEASTWTICTLYWTHEGLDSSFITGKTCRLYCQISKTKLFSKMCFWIIRGEN